jgi:hypothetical protein
LRIKEQETRLTLHEHDDDDDDDEIQCGQSERLLNLKLVGASRDQ